ncbi:MAG: hypothetical protein H0T89_31345, partial [Deltaproteobacteria bacterium]|nr:hypothetical protein [Deltaproteobacteria bacterium]
MASVRASDTRDRRARAQGAVCCGAQERHQERSAGRPQPAGRRWCARDEGRDRAEAFAGVEGVSLEPIDIHRQKKILKGWVFVRVLRWAPLDRARAKLNLWGSKDPFLGIPSVIEAPAFDRPPARIFRIVESPRY